MFVNIIVIISLVRKADEIKSEIAEHLFGIKFVSNEIDKLSMIKFRKSSLWRNRAEISISRNSNFLIRAKIMYKSIWINPKGKRRRVNLINRSIRSSLNDSSLPLEILNIRLIIGI